jgi:hypothetical protein
MTKEYVTKWYNALPQGERDLPLILLDGIVYTPTTAYNEVIRNSPVGIRLQALIESGRFGTTAEDEQAIAKTRLEQWLRSQPDKPLFATLSNKVFTPSQLLEEIQSGTSIGEQWVGNEISHMKNLMQLK